MSDEGAAAAELTWDTIDIQQVRYVAWSSIRYFQETMWRSFGCEEPLHRFVLAMLRRRLERAGRHSARGLAIACGDMAGEREFFESPELRFDRVDGYDLSRASIDRFEARHEIDFHWHQVNCNYLDLEDVKADLIIGWHGLHHIYNL